MDIQRVVYAYHGSLESSNYFLKLWIGHCMHWIVF